jgi:serine/threonine protein kinase
VELRIGQILTDALHSNNLIRQKCNFIKVYDWNRCRIEPKEVLDYKKGIITEEDWERIFKPEIPMKHNYFGGEDDYQFIVMELVDGDYYNLIETNYDMAYSDQTLGSMLLQILCCHHQLYDLYGFVHWDLHLGNIMYVQGKDVYEPDTYVYTLADGQVLYLSGAAMGTPLLFKMGDFGMARVVYPSKISSDGRVLSGSIGRASLEGDAGVDNPAYDLHKLALNILTNVLAFQAEGEVPTDGSIFSPDMADLLLTMVNSKWVNPENQRRYRAVAEGVRQSQIPNADRDVLRNASEDCYQLQNQLFASPSKPKDLICDLMKHTFFDRYRHRPAKLYQETTTVMDLPAFHLAHNVVVPFDPSEEVRASGKMRGRRAPSRPDLIKRSDKPAPEWDAEYEQMMAAWEDGEENPSDKIIFHDDVLAKKN